MRKKRDVGKVEARLVKIARRKGLRVEYAPNTTITARLPPILYAHDWALAHELGHWICATPKRRCEPFFGLGDPDGEYGKLSELFCDREDVRAHIVGAAMLWIAKAAEENIRRYICNHAFLLSHPDQNSMGIMDRLCTRGLISNRAKKAVARIWNAEHN